MERQEFLKTLGISFAAVCVGSCISACGKKDDATPATPPPAGTIVSADLSKFTSIGFKEIVIGSGVSIAIFRIATGDTAASFIATQPLCTHQQGELNWKTADNLIQCQLHQAQFTQSGVNTRGPSTGGTTANLKTYANITIADGKVNVKIV
ncbi:MAG: Rieske (2Fe-2S) protein [Sphingobacteriales bacterium]|nr:MAG: Rieske (2Fe-2S) protein [Sphingobacteriales bacterium]